MYSLLTGCQLPSEPGWSGGRFGCGADLFRTAETRRK